MEEATERADFWGLAGEFYDDEIPEYVVEVEQTFITVMTGNEWEGTPKPLKVTMEDVVRYYRTQAGDITSGVRTLAGFSSDLRGIDRLAQECLAWFEFVNQDGLRRLAKAA